MFTSHPEIDAFYLEIGGSIYFFGYSTILGERIERDRSLYSLIVFDETEMGNLIFLDCGTGLLNLTFLIISSKNCNCSCILILLYKFETSFIGGDNGY